MKSAEASHFFGKAYTYNLWSYLKIQMIPVRYRMNLILGRVETRNRTIYYFGKKLLSMGHCRQKRAAGLRPSENWTPCTMISQSAAFSSKLTVSRCCSLNEESCVCACMDVYRQDLIFLDISAEELAVWTLLFGGPEEPKDFSSNSQVTHLRQSENPIHALL